MRARRRRPRYTRTGIDRVMTRAKCCSPIHGEPIVGYSLARGKGIAVHSAQCSNVQNLMYEVDRKIEVDWARGARNRCR